MPTNHEPSPTRVRYAHRQTGWPMLASAFVPLAFAVVRLLIRPDPRTWPAPLLPALCVVTIVLLVGFSSLAVTVAGDRLIARFGIGLMQRTIALADIADLRIERTRWYEGWGIHLSGRGMLYNVGGFDVVALRLTGGRRLRIGSDDVERLAAVLRRAVAERRANRPPGA